MYGAHRDLHVLTHLFPPLRASELRQVGAAGGAARQVGTGQLDLCQVAAAERGAGEYAAMPPATLAHHPFDMAQQLLLRRLVEARQTEEDVGAVQLGAAEIGAAEPGVAELAAAEVGAPEVGDRKSTRLNSSP